MKECKSFRTTLEDEEIMNLPKEVLELENKSIGTGGEPTLGSAFEILLEAWNSGDKGREIGLHLMFLAWYLLCEPPHLTGLDGPGETQVAAFNEVHGHFKPIIENDSEMLYVVGLMAHLFPDLLGDCEEWERISKKYRVIYRALEPDGFPLSQFEGRGAYGEYFSGHVALEEGY